MSGAEEAAGSGSGSGGGGGGEARRRFDDKGLVARTSLILWHTHQNDAAAVRKLLEEDGALVNARDYDSRTPLHVAALHGWLDVAECLLANGADLNAQDSWRNTPLADAEGAKRHAMIELLKKYGGLTYGQSGSHFEAKTIPPPLTNNDDWELNPLEYDFTKATIGKVYNGEGSSIFSSNITPGSSSEFDHKSTGENVSNKTVGIPGKGDYPSASMEQSSSYIKEPEKVLHPQAPSTTTFNSTESEPFSSSYPPIDSSPEVADIQGMLQQVVQRFQELFSQTKYKEAAELAVEFPQGLLRTPETVAKFKGAPLQLGQVSPLLQYFATLLTRGKLNAYESLELSRLAISQNGKNLLEGWLADDKLECSEELGHLVKTVDDDLALKIYIKARDNPRVVAAFNERIEFDNIIIYPKLPEKAGTLKGPGEISYKVYNGEGSSIFSSNITSGSSSEMADLASEIEALDRILSDASAQPTKLSYALMKSVTNNFSKVIGRGGFAVVYQGFLRNGKIAVKKLSLSNGFSDELFVDEIECLTKAKHNNVVRYLGYCADTQGELMEFNGRCVIAEVPKRLLCFEFVPNGSLQRYLKAKLCGDEWQVRYKMIKGICQGLHFLHKIRINHLDLKPGNILLDVGMEPKIADFGLSRCFDEEQSRVFTKNICGTRGYIAPEIINRGEISFKSDIFALGIIIIKLLTGHNDYDIENWHKSLNAGCQQVRRCIEIAQACVDDDQHKRPAIGEIIHKLDELEASVNSPAIN